MSMVSISLNEDFSHTPGPRLRRQGAHSAEEFFERHIAPNFEKAQKRDVQLLIDLDGTAGVAASFLDEICSRMVGRFGAEEVRDRLWIVSVEEPRLEEEITRYISEAA